MDNQITPGEILLEEFLEPMGISQKGMARAIGVSPRAINEIVHSRRSTTPAMSVRFGAFFGQSDEFWHGLPGGVRLPQDSGGKARTGVRDPAGRYPDSDLLKPRAAGWINHPQLSPLP